jgi:hypothetical protein
MLRQALGATVIVLLLVGMAHGQGANLASSEAKEFIGTWVFTMSEPPGAQETVRIMDKGGRIVASVQAQQFPPLDVSDVAKFGEVLLFGATRFENGKPVQALIILRPVGDTMSIIQELEGSTITKRGSGRKQ